MVRFANIMDRFSNSRTLSISLCTVNCDVSWLVEHLHNYIEGITIVKCYEYTSVTHLF